MVTTKLNLSMTEPSVRQIYAKQGDTGRVLDISLDQTPEDGTLRILRPDGVEVTSEAVTGGEVSESGETITFESMTEADVTELTVGIEPVQDLNGYDKPWVGGAGKNLLPYPYYENTKTVNGITFTVKADGTVVANGTATSNAIFLFQGGDWTISENYILSGCPSGGSGTTYSLQVQNTGNVTLYDYGSGVTLPSGTYHSILFIVRSGYTANNLTAKPMLRKATVTDNTWQPYSNICPITGHDEVRVIRTGKNLLDTSTVTVSGITFTQDSGGRLSASPNNSDPRTWGYANSQYKVTLPKGSYTIVAEVDTVTSGTSNALIVANKDGTRLTNFVANPFGTVGIKTASFTLTEETPIGVMAKQYDAVYRLMIVASGESTSYEPYQGSTYTTSLGQTVYGGTLDMVTGQLVVNYKKIDLGNYNYGKASDNNFYIYTVTDFKVYGTGTTRYGLALCDSFAFLTGNWKPHNSTCTCYYNADYNGYRIFFHSEEHANDSTAEFKAYMQSIGASFVYELATPLTYTLTPQQIKTLIGTNNVWASSGDIVNITFTYGGLLSELPSEATEIVGKCYCDIEQNGVSSMPFTLNVKKNERQ